VLLGVHALAQQAPDGDFISRCGNPAVEISAPHCARRPEAMISADGSANAEHIRLRQTPDNEGHGEVWKNTSFSS
jgi:hypothetical protein